MNHGPRRVSDQVEQFRVRAWAEPPQPSATTGHFGGTSFLFSGGGDSRMSQASCGTDRLVPQRLQTQMSTFPVRTAKTISFDKQTGQRGINSHGSGGSPFVITRQYQGSKRQAYGKHWRSG